MNQAISIAEPSTGAPAPAADKDRVRSILRRDVVVVGVLVCAIVVVPWIVTAYTLTLLISVGIAMGLAVSWNLLAQTGQISLGHAAFVGTGAYSTALLVPNAGLALGIAGIAVAGVVGGLLGAAIGRLSSNMAPWVLSIVTLAVSETLRVVATQAKGLTHGSLGVFTRSDVGIDHALSFRVVYGVVLVSVLITLVIRRGRLHYAFNATRMHRRAAEMAGIDTRRIRVIALAISGFCAGMIGGFYGLYIGFVDPDSAFSFQFTIEAKIFSIVGGVYTFIGPLIGALSGGVLDEKVRSAFPNADLIAEGLLLVVFILWAPGGLIGIFRSVVHRVRARGTDA